MNYIKYFKSHFALARKIMFIISNIIFLYANFQIIDCFSRNLLVRVLPQQNLVILPIILKALPNIPEYELPDMKFDLNPYMQDIGNINLQVYASKETKKWIGPNPKLVYSDNSNTLCIEYIDKMDDMSVWYIYTVQSPSKFSDEVELKSVDLTRELTNRIRKEYYNLPRPVYSLPKESLNTFKNGNYIIRNK